MTILKMGVPNPNVTFKCPVCKSEFFGVYNELIEQDLGDDIALYFDCPVCGSKRPTYDLEILNNPSEYEMLLVKPDSL